MSWKWIGNGLIDTDADDYILWATMPVPDDAAICVKPEYENVIAAAPLLLAACEASLELYNEQLRIVVGCGFEDAEINCEVGKQLRAAIAAARPGE